jgi:pimeloyl-ACP methyl ester carboxylesterase
VHAASQASKPIVFISGLFDVFPAELARQWFAPRVALSPDLLGYGKHRGTPPDLITMESQADYVASAMRDAGITTAHLIGQSIGGVIAALVARKHPALAASLVSVEGNFTLDDAFWSRRIAAMEEVGVSDVLAGYRADPRGWLAGSGIEATPEKLAIANRALAVAPLTLQAMARSVIEATTGDKLIRLVEQLMDEGLRVRLLAGERSRDGWSVPDAIVRRAGGVHIQRGAGHLMMLEDPSTYFRLIAELTAAES